MQIAQCCSAAITLLHYSDHHYVPFQTWGFSPLIKGMTTMLLSHITRFLRQWRRYNASLRELSQLGDRELSDMGISRSDIPRIAWEGSNSR